MPRNAEKNCAISHPQIVSGPCPWCGEMIGEMSQPLADGPSQKTQTRWNPVAVAAGIRSDDVCITTVLGLGRGWEFDDGMLPVLEWAVRDSDKSLRYFVEIALRRAAWDLTASNLEQLERLCSDDACALVAHLILINYYSFVEHRCARPNPPRIDGGTRFGRLEMYRGAEF